MNDENDKKDKWKFKKRYSIRQYKYDLSVILGIAIVLTAIYGIIVYGSLSRIKEETLIYELRELRSAVATYYYMNGRKPKSLDELANSEFKTDRGTKRPYVSTKIVDRGLSDPFGNPYIYDRKNGWVKSSSENYSRW